MQDKKAILFINGTPPKMLPEFDEHTLVACTDGAFQYLQKLNFRFEKLDFISGDFDSHSEILQQIKEGKTFPFQVYHTPDQDQTDFEKALEILSQKGIINVDVYGGSGGEMDHFLGNVSVAMRFKERLNIHFFDEYATYFFADHQQKLHEVKDKTISLYPFPTAEKVSTKGLKWPLEQDVLDITGKIGTRNIAVDDTVEITFERGALLIFIGQH